MALPVRRSVMIKPGEATSVQAIVLVKTGFVVVVPTLEMGDNRSRLGTFQCESDEFVMMDHEVTQQGGARSRWTLRDEKGFPAAVRPSATVRSVRECKLV